MYYLAGHVYLRRVLRGASLRLSLWSHVPVTCLAPFEWNTAYRSHKLLPTYLPTNKSYFYLFYLPTYR